MPERTPHAILVILMAVGFAACGSSSGSAESEPSVPASTEQTSSTSPPKQLTPTTSTATSQATPSTNPTPSSPPTTLASTPQPTTPAGNGRDPIGVVVEEVTATRGWSGNGADCVRAGTIELVDTETEQLAAEGFGAPPTEELRQRVLAVVEQVADQCGLTPAATSSATPAPTPQPGTGTAQPVTTPGSVAAPATSRP